MVVLVIALTVAPIDWSPEVVVLVPVTIVSGLAIFGSVWVATSSLSFWTVDSQEFGNAFTYGGGLAAQYPIDVLSTLAAAALHLPRAARLRRLRARIADARPGAAGRAVARGLGHPRRWPPPRSESPAPSGGWPSATIEAPGADRAL